MYFFFQILKIPKIRQKQVTKLDMNDASAANGSPDFGALMQIMGNLCG
jgi:hypothetical protein